jgi:hypothetical protein
MLAEGPRPPPPTRRPRAAALAVAAIAALAAHWLVLGGDELMPAWPEATASASAPAPAMQVRSVDPPAPAMTTHAEVPASPPPLPKPTPRPVARPRLAVARPADTLPASDIAMQAAAPAPSLALAAVTVASPDLPPTAATLDGDLVKTAASAAPPAEPERKLPTYRTAMPPGATLHYDMQKGMWSGSGDLIWRPAGERYELRLEGSVAGLHVLTEVSSGGIDGHGLAPLRYTDQRLRRSPIAANFQRDKGRITYSGTTASFPLPEGAQDRLSWMLQIGAVLNAEPQLAAPGGRIVFFVSGARGDADVWSFRYVGTETVAAAGGRVAAVKFTREPRKAYDHLVEVWLAPAHHHLPVRARLTADSNDSVFELLLRDIRSP